MDAVTEDAVSEVLRLAVLPMVDAAGGAVVDGGTDSGVMRAAGRAEMDWPGLDRTGLPASLPAPKVPPAT